MVTNAGSGYSRCQGLDVTRWREDPTCEAWGQFFYVRDLQRGRCLVGRTPAGLPAGRRLRGGLLRRQGHVPPPRRRHRDLLEITVSPEQPAEVRRVTLTNHGSQPRELELTSYAELVLVDHGADLAHPAFGKLFLETEWIAGVGRPALPAPAAVRRRAARSGRSTSWRSTARPRAARSWATCSTRPTGPGSWAGGGRLADPGRARARRDALGDDRPGPRPGLQPPPPVPARARRIGRRRVHPGRWPSRATRRWPWPTSTTESAPWPGPSSWPGPTARSSTAIGTGRPRMPTCTSGWGRTSSSPVRPCGPTRPVLAANRQGPAGPLAIGHLGRPADRPGPDRRGGRARPGPAAPGRARLPPAQGPGVRPRPARRGAGRRRRRPRASSSARLVARPAGDDLADQPGGVFVLRRGGTLRGRCRSCSRRRPVSSSTEPGGSLAGQLDRIEWGRTAARALVRIPAAGPTGTTSRSACRPTCCSSTAWVASPPMAANTACSIRCPGRHRPASSTASRRTERYRIRRLAPGPLGQRGRQSRVRLPRLRERARASPGRATARRIA